MLSFREYVEIQWHMFYYNEKTLVAGYACACGQYLSCVQKNTPILTHNSRRCSSEGDLIYIMSKTSAHSSPSKF